MLGFLFRTLTAQPSRGAAVFDAITAETRKTHWYVEGEVPDTIDGRFAVLSSIVALMLVRTEREGDSGVALSVGLTERFVEAMEAEHRELGLGDPTLGKTVRRLVGSLSRRVELWRDAVSGTCGWAQASEKSLYSHVPANEALAFGTALLREIWDRLDHTSLACLSAGELA